MKYRVPLLAGCTLEQFRQLISAAQPLTLDELSIAGSALAERVDGPVRGYRATHSSTATRTDSDKRDVPRRIYVECLNTMRIDRALNLAGSVSRQNNFGGLTFLNYSVRGITTGAVQERPAINRGSYSAPDTSNIERIETLKGPAASLYGRGDPGGLVNIVTKRHKAETFSSLNINADTWDRYRSSVDVNSPLDIEGNLLARINIAIDDNSSFRDHDESRRWIIGPSLSWQVSPDTKLMLDTESSRAESVLDRGIPAVNGELGSAKGSTFVGEPNDDQIHNDNQTIDLTLEQYLNDDWKVRLANHYMSGTLSA